jgi:hypothetical protein
MPLAGAMISSLHSGALHLVLTVVSVSNVSGSDGMEVRAARGAIRGLVISGFGGSGVDIRGAKVNNTIEGYFTGTDASGSLRRGNGRGVVQSAGVRLSEGAHDNRIGTQSTLKRRCRFCRASKRGRCKPKCCGF